MGVYLISYFSRNLKDMMTTYIRNSFYIFLKPLIRKRISVRKTKKLISNIILGIDMPVNKMWCYC